MYNEIELHKKFLQLWSQKGISPLLAETTKKKVETGDSIWQVMRWDSLKNIFKLQHIRRWRLLVNSNFTSFKNLQKSCFILSEPFKSQSSESVHLSGFIICADHASECDTSKKNTFLNALSASTSWLFKPLQCWDWSIISVWLFITYIYSNQLKSPIDELSCSVLYFMCYTICCRRKNTDCLLVAVIFEIFVD